MESCTLRNLIPFYLKINAFFSFNPVLLPQSLLEKEKTDKGGGLVVEVKDQLTSSKPQKEKPSKAERRALQEAQRAAKAAAKGLY